MSRVVAKCLILKSAGSCHLISYQKCSLRASGNLAQAERINIKDYWRLRQSCQLTKTVSRNAVAEFLLPLFLAYCA